MNVGDRVTKDGRPGTVVGFADDIEAAFIDIDLDDGKSTYVRLPDYGGRVRRLHGLPMTDGIA